MHPAAAVAATNAPRAAANLANNFIFCSPFSYNFYNSVLGIHLKTKAKAFDTILSLNI
jgi:hypothetical protein